MATAVYLVHYKQARHHFRHAVRRIDGPMKTIRTLYRRLDDQPIDPLATSQGIGFMLVRTWKGQDEAFAQRLKRQKHHSRLCPVCNPDGYSRRTVKIISSG